MNHLTTAAPAAFTPEPGLPWLRHDPAMQCREAFADTANVRLDPHHDLLGSAFPGGTSVLLRRVHTVADIVPGAVYAFAENGMEGPIRKHRASAHACDFARVTGIARTKQGKGYRFAALNVRYDNTAAAQRDYSWVDEAGQTEWCIWLKGLWSADARRECPNYKATLWRVTHYIDLSERFKAGALGAGNYETERRYGATPDQARFMQDEYAVCGTPPIGYASLGATIATVETAGQRYPSRLDECLNKSDAAAVAGLLQELPGLCPAHAARSKSPVVRIALRTAAGTSSRHYPEASVRVVLDLLESLRREREAREALLDARISQQLQARRQQPAPAQLVPVRRASTTNQRPSLNGAQQRPAFAQAAA